MTGEGTIWCAQCDGPIDGAIAGEPIAGEPMTRWGMTFCDAHCLGRYIAGQDAPDDTPSIQDSLGLTPSDPPRYPY